MSLSISPLAVALLLALVKANTGVGDPQPGDYCPFPKAGEKPACMAPAEREYGDFFDSLDAGGLADADSRKLEADLRATKRDERSYLALSSLTYGYFRLAQRAASDPDAHPALVARLTRWNQVLSAAYAGSEGDERFRSALLEAAVDLHARAPAVQAKCDGEIDGKGCNTTGGLLAKLAAIEAQAGTRTALSRLLERVFGEESP